MDHQPHGDFWMCLGFSWSLHSARGPWGYLHPGGQQEKEETGPSLAKVGVIDSELHAETALGFQELLG